MNASDPDRPLGAVPIAGRRELPFLVLAGQPLVDLATAALVRAGVHVIASDTPWSTVRDSAVPLVLQDPLCPLTPASFVSQAIGAASSSDAVVVGYRPVTDTIKTVTEGRVEATVPRDGLLAVASPVVLPASLVAKLDDWPDLSDFAALVTWLRSRVPVRLLEAPSLGRRVSDASDVRLLEGLAGPAGQDT